MIHIDYPPQNLPKMEQICRHSVSYENVLGLQELQKLEKLGHFVVIIPCEDGMIVIQRVGKDEPNYPVTVTQH